MICVICLLQAVSPQPFHALGGFSQEPAVPHLHSIQPQKLQSFANICPNSLSAQRSTQPSKAMAGMGLHLLVMLLQELPKVSGFASVHQLCLLDL